MAAKIVFACVVFAVTDVITAQVIRSGCGCGGVDVIPNQVILNQAGLLAQSGLLAQPGFLAPNMVGPACVNGQFALPCTNTVIQDNSVATNLANTLQLLLVSNLLSNTLPNTPDVVLPPLSPYAGGLSYIC